MQKITFEDTQVTKKPYVTINETEYEVQDGTYTGGTDLNATAFNNMQDNIESAINNITTISSGTVTSSDAIASVEVSNVRICGQVVYFYFTATTSKNLSNTEILFTGLPTVPTNIRFAGIDASKDLPVRFGLDANGTVKNAYTGHTIENGAVIEGYVCYITNQHAVG